MVKRAPWGTEQQYVCSQSMFRYDFKSYYQTAIRMPDYGLYRVCGYFVRCQAGSWSLDQALTVVGSRSWERRMHAFDRLA